MLPSICSAEGYREERGIPFYKRLIAELGDERAIISASFAKTVPPLDWSDRVPIFEPGTEPFSRGAARR